MTGRRSHGRRSAQNGVVHQGKMVSEPGTSGSPGTSVGGALEPGPRGTRLVGGVSPYQALVWNVGTCRSDAKGDVQVGSPHEDQRTNAGHRDGAARGAAWHGGKQYGVSFLPAAGRKAMKEVRRVIRRWGLQRRSDKALGDLARRCNPSIRGWINYYGHFYKSALRPTLRRIDVYLITWARRKFKRLRQKPKGARDWLARVIRTSPGLFAHWRLLHVGWTLGAG